MGCCARLDRHWLGWEFPRVSTRERAVVLVSWLALGPVVGVVCGAASALFLWLLEHATAQRTAHSRLVYALPLAGLAIGWTYQRFGAQVRAGNNLVIDTIHEDGAELPLRMAPLVLVGTVVTHLFGGSAGREGRPCSWAPASAISSRTA
jgi:H+/Cl- antiporter ClcA